MKQSTKPILRYTEYTNIGLIVGRKIINKWGIFVEPRVAYYFDDGSSIQTIRKEKPFNFNIQEQKIMKKLNLILVALYKQGIQPNFG